MLLYQNNSFNVNISFIISEYMLILFSVCIHSHGNCLNFRQYIHNYSAFTFVSFVMLQPDSPVVDIFFFFCINLHSVPHNVKVKMEF